MESWRDTASTDAQADLDELFNAVLPLAEQHLARYGEFFPFGAALSADGQVKILGGDPGQGERPQSQAVLDVLYQGAREDGSAHRAAAFVADVLAEGVDAVRVELEHREGNVLTILVPYSRSRLKRAITFGQMRVSAGQARVWGVR
ncbi:MAG TPA: hypothetical protein VGH96_05805 [Streptosporangiaceae bacterium]|jgi:hypothetical protein